LTFVTLLLLVGAVGVPVKTLEDDAEAEAEALEAIGVTCPVSHLVRVNRLNILWLCRLVSLIRLRLGRVVLVLPLRKPTPLQAPTLVLGRLFVRLVAVALPGSILRVEPEVPLVEAVPLREAKRA